MADFYRLEDPSYLGGLPGSHGWINNDPAAPGARAYVDGPKTGHPTQNGTYFVAFEEDALSEHFNRANWALATNTDWLDDVISGEVPVPTELTVTTPGGATSSKQITGSVFVGMSGIYTNTQEWRDKLIEVIDPTTGKEMLDVFGQRVQVSEIRKSDDLTNAVGNEASGFTTNPFVKFSPQIPDQDYRLVYGVKSTLKEIVKDKTRLDAMTRQTIKTSSQVSAEVDTFMKQASRRSGGYVQGLVSQVFETPGAGDNKYTSKSAYMVFDADPTDDVGAVKRYFRFRAGRDGVARVLAVLEEDSYGSATINFGTFLSAGSLRLFDKWMFDDNGPMALTEALHRYYRVHDADYGSQPALMRMINAGRYGVTIGDGVNTFGDFDGASAISSALTWLNANVPANKPLHLFLKAGAYTVTSTISLPGGRSVFIHGPDNPAVGKSTGAVITNNTGNNANATFTGASTTALFISNCTFDRSGGTDGDFAYDGEGTLHMDDCYVDQALRVNANGTREDNFVFFRRTRMTTLDNNVNQPVFTLYAGGSVRAGSIVFEDCFFISKTNYPAFKLHDLGSVTANSYISSITFNRCHLDLDGADTTTPGAFDGNPGAFEIYTATAGNLTLGSLLWQDCLVESTGTKDAHVLLYYRDTATGGVNYIKTGHLQIRGGRWVVTESTELSPFYIGSHQYNQWTEIEHVTIEDLDWGFDITGTADYGTAHNELNWSDGQSEWAAFFIGRVSNLHLENIKFIKCNAHSVSGDLFLFGPGDGSQKGSLYVGHIDMNRWDLTTGGSIPTTRVKMRWDSANHMGAVIDGIQACNITANGGCCSRAFYEFVPNGNPVEVRRLVLRNHNIGTVTAHAIRVGWTSDEGPVAINFRDCEVFGVGGAGLHIYDDGTSFQDFSGSVIDCIFDACGSDTTSPVLGCIFIGGSTTTAETIWSVRLLGNRCYGGKGPGIVLAPGFWSTDSNFIIANNHCIGSDSTSGRYHQILIGYSSSEGFGAGAKGVIMGNNCGSESTNQNFIGVTFDGGGPAPTDLDALFGVETSISGTTKTITDLGVMIQNQASLKLLSV